MKNIKLFTAFFFLFIGSLCYSQDPSLSQYYFNQTYFNPASAGIHGGSNLSITYRRQWVNVPGKFETIFANFDTDISSAKGLGGIGVSVYKDVEGEGFLTTLGLSLMLNSRIELFESHFIQVGASISVLRKTADWSKFTFGDQFDPIYGNIRPTGFPAADDQYNISPDLGIGLVYAFGKGPNRRQIKNNYNAKIGIAIQHLNEPNQSFLDQKSKLPKKLVAHVNFNFGMNHDASIIFSPCIVFEYQEAFNYNLFGMKTLYGGYNLLWKNFFIGTWLRLFNNSDALIFNAGFITGNENSKHKLKMYYSYDMTVSSLTSKSTGGTHEISLGYFFPEKLNIKHKKKNNPVYCPDSF